MLSNDELRRLLEQPDLSEREIEEFRASLHAFLNAVLDDYFRDFYE